MSASDSSVYTGHPGTDAHTKQISFTMFCTMKRQKRIPFEMSEIFTTVFLSEVEAWHFGARSIDWLAAFYHCKLIWLYGRLIDWLSVFTGVALLYMHLYKNVGPFQKFKYLKVALSHVEPHLSKLKLRRPSFICGEAGLLAVGAVLLNQLNMKEKAEDCVKKCVDPV